MIGLTNPNGQSNRSLIGVQIFFLSFGLTLDCHVFKFSFIFYLDLPSIASSSNFHSFFHLNLSSIASQTHSYPLTWTYLRVPIWLRFDFVAHVYLIGLITLMPMRKGFKSSLVGIWAFENSDFLKLPSFSSKVFLKLLLSARPFFTLHSCFRQENMSHAMCYVMYDHEWHV